MYLVFYLTVVFVWAAIYYYLSPISKGLSPVDGGVTFWESLYFSVVTVSSLGYGDFRPVGVSRGFAGFQVLFGLFVLGILIAKFTSSRLTHKVDRLYMSQVVSQLEGFSFDFNKSDDLVKSYTRDAGRVYQVVPGEQHKLVSSAHKTELFLILRNIQLRTEQFMDYLQEENTTGGFFNTVPVRPMSDAANGLESNVHSLGNIFLNLSNAVLSHLFDKENRKCLGSMVETVKELEALVKKNCEKREDVYMPFHDLALSISGIPERYYNVPDVGGKLQPDQSLQDQDDPQ